MPLPNLFSSLGDNQLFEGAIGLGLLAGILKSFQPLGQLSKRELRRRLTVSREVTTNDKETFNIIGEYISEKLPSMTNHSSVSFETASRLKSQGDSESSRVFNNKPSPGVYLSKYKDTWLQIERVRTTTVGVPFESLKLTTRGPPAAFSKNQYHGNQILDKMFQDAERMYQESINDKIVIYEPDTSSWRPFGHAIRKRKLPTVILDKNQGERILQDMELFLNSSDWYIDKGISHQRGYLFHGPPGTGKTSFIKALAGALNYNIAIFNVGSWHMDDHRLLTLLNNVPPNTMILFEDIDCCMPSRESSRGAFTGPGAPAANTPDPRFQGMQGGTSFSGLLNALDGIVGGEGRIICMTTNHFERLDPALIRPGRCDVKEYFGYATDEMIKKIYLSYFSGEEKLADQFVPVLRQNMESIVAGRGKTISMADVQNILMMQRDRPDFFYGPATPGMQSSVESEVEREKASDAS